MATIFGGAAGAAPKAKPALEVVVGALAVGGGEAKPSFTDDSFDSNEDGDLEVLAALLANTWDCDSRHSDCESRPHSIS